MASSDISILGLQATGGVNQIVLQWAVNDPNVEKLPYFRFDAAEVWAATSSSMVGATKIGEASTAFVHLPIARGETRFYQVRARDVSGRLGAFTAPVGGTEISGDVLLATNGYWKNPNGLILQWGSVPVTGLQTIAFPTPFPHACFTLVAIPRTILPLVIYNFLVSFTRFDFTFFCANNSGGAATTTIQWLAVGH